MAAFTRWSVATGLLVALTASAHAVVPRRGPRPEARTLTAMPGSGIKPLRVERTLAWGQATPGLPWLAFTHRRGARWQAAWDEATGVPVRIWGQGIATPGAMASASLAEQYARSVLAEHLSLLAPGAALSDFVLVANHTDGTMRSIGFVQRSGGRRVVGGQVSFRFKADRLFVIGSEALPDVKVAAPRARLASAELHGRAAAALRSGLALSAAPVSWPGDEVVLPLVADRAVLGYRLARPMEIDGGVDGRYLAYADVVTGAILAVRQLNAYATGTVRLRTVDRHPARARVERAAQRAFVSVNGAQQTSNMLGQVTWSGGGDADLVASATGELVEVVSKAAEAVAATGSFSLADGGSAVWDATGAEFDDAQVNAYAAAMIVKEYVRDHVDAQMPTLDDQITVNVNIAQNCNAFFDGSSINFFQANDSCQNTALLQDVVYHEYGHRLHTAEIIPGVGDFDGSMSEGVADFLAASITNDSGMGRGFFYSDAPLRELDPPDREWSWPGDIGQIHYTGQIYGGTFWDLRKALIEAKGEAAGVALVNRLYLASVRRAINIPSSLIEALAEDDDDGDLSNGSPNECAIRQAFGRHGMRTATGTVVAPGQLGVNALAIGVHVVVSGLTDRCAGDEVAGAELSWTPPYTGVPRAGSTEAVPAGTGRYFAQLPLSPQESVYYKAKIKFTDGSSLTLADNLADRYYQLYQGETVELYCTDFESSDPFGEGWTTGTDDGSPSPFQWGAPTAGTTDPHAAYSGSKILAQTLDGDYNPDQRAWLKLPTIDVGAYSDVRLHYRRWLAVEDSHFDTAMVTANGNKAWVNWTGDIGDDSALHHVDKEWRFHDVALSGYFSGHELTVGFEISSDAGLELGGWHLDDVCVVANPYAICGDGVRTATEQCDGGAANRDQPDTCRTDCRLPRCGDLIVDSREACDAGPQGDAVCSPQCQLIPATGDGGCSAQGDAGRWWLAAWIAGALALRRRRRRA